MRDEESNVIKTTQESSDLLFRMGDWHFLDGLYLGMIDFDTFTAEDKTYKLSGSYSKRALVRV